MTMEKLMGIAELARMAKVSSRTLRHYDHSGLLPPRFRSAQGYRYYDRASVLQLQRILLLRELGLSLETIKDVIEGQTDRLEALTIHRRWLVAERERYGQLIATVERTIAALEEEREIDMSELFTGFESNPYEKEARERWGREAVEEANVTWASMSSAQRRQTIEEAGVINAELAAAQSMGKDPASDEVQAIIARHYAWVSVSWTPDAQSYRGLGQLYCEDERFGAFYEKANLSPEYLRQGMEAYAENHLD